MILQEKYRNIIIEMTNFAQDHIKTHFTDFTSFDIPTLCEYIRLIDRIHLHSVLIWCVRSTGTHLLYLKAGKELNDFPAFIDINKWFFCINLEDAEINKIDKEEALRIVKNWEEEL